MDRDNADASVRRPRNSSCRNSLVDDSDLFAPISDGLDIAAAQNLDFTRISDAASDACSLVSVSSTSLRMVDLNLKFLCNQFL